LRTRFAALFGEPASMKEIIATEHEDGIYRPSMVIGEITPEGRELEFFNKPAEIKWIGSAQCEKHSGFHGYPADVATVDEMGL
jgi:hypothetical protein